MTNAPLLKSSLTPSTTRHGRLAHLGQGTAAFFSLTELHSTSYSDSEYEYRHVQLPKSMLKAIPDAYHDEGKGTLKLLWEEEWRALGITQVCSAVGPPRWVGWQANISKSLGWEHYEVHEPEPHILLFK